MKSKKNESNEVLSNDQKQNLSEIKKMLTSSFTELVLTAEEEAAWEDIEEPFENTCFLRYFIDGCGIYFSEHGEIVYDDDMPASSFHINAVEETRMLKPFEQMPIEIREQLTQLRALNEVYSNRMFTVVSQNKKHNTIIVSSENFPDAYWELSRLTFDELGDELIATLENVQPDSTFDEPVPGI